MGDVLITNENKELAGELINMAIRFIFVVAMFSVNFLALSIALQCNKDKGLGRKVLVGAYAFLFGFIYLFVNYYSYRVMTLGQICEINKNELFPL